MHEIGGYFGMETLAGEAYHAALIAVNSGRNALLYLLKARNVQKLYIPRFLCDTVSRLCERERYAYETYAIDRAFRPLFDKPLGDGEWLYLVNFYGQLSNEEIAIYHKRYERVIVDNVQAFFQRPVPHVDTVYSCRKFFGVPDGGYVSTEAMLSEPLSRDVSGDRMKHILGRYEASASDFYADFQKNDELFYDLELKAMSALTENLLRAVEYETARQCRNANYATLEKALGTYNALPLAAPDGPYCYPLYCKNGIQVKRLLAQQKIYVPTLWPNVLDCDGTLEKEYAENILPLPCDQRYNAQDMERIVAAVLPLVK